jgi:hypothetical protein
MAQDPAAPPRGGLGQTIIFEPAAPHAGQRTAFDPRFRLEPLIQTHRDHAVAEALRRTAAAQLAAVAAESGNVGCP